MGVVGARNGSGGGDGGLLEEERTRGTEEVEGAAS